MGAGTDHAIWLRRVLTAARKTRGWSLQRAATEIAREMGKASMSKQALQQWESFETHPSVAAYAAWARAMGLKLDVDLVDPKDERVEIRVPPGLVEVIRRLERLEEEDVAEILRLATRLSRDSA